MTTNGDTEPAPDRVTVAPRSLSQLPSAGHEASLEFGQLQILMRRGN
jgi:hypothetical protein